MATFDIGDCSSSHPLRCLSAIAADPAGSVIVATLCRTDAGGRPLQVEHCFRVLLKKDEADPCKSVVDIRVFDPLPQHEPASPADKDDSVQITAALGITGPGAGYVVFGDTTGALRVFQQLVGAPGSARVRLVAGLQFQSKVTHVAASPKTKVLVAVTGNSYVLVLGPQPPAPMRKIANEVVILHFD